jgi:anti-sigma B factor antagonist
MPVASNASGASPPSSPAFQISRRELDGQTSVLAVTGELDLSSAPDLKWALTDALDASAQVIVDLSKVSFLDSTALGVLVGAKRRLSAKARLPIVCADPNVLRIFELTGLLGTFELFSTLELALQSARGDATAAG